jgi:hypothetical protein
MWGKQRRSAVDELIKKVSEKAGINPEQAKNAVQGVLDFIKAKMPAVGDQVSALIAGGGGSVSDVLGSVRDKFKI